MNSTNAKNPIIGMDEFLKGSNLNVYQTVNIEGVPKILPLTACTGAPGALSVIIPNQLKY